MESLLVILAVAFMLDLVLGDPHSRLHPVALLGALAMRIENLCRRLMGASVISGLTGWLVVIATAIIPAYGTTRIVTEWLGWPWDALSAGLWLYICIASRSLWQHAEKIRRPLIKGDLPAARKALALIVSRETDHLDGSEIARGAVESLGENLVDGVNSAVFWAVIGWLAGGPPLAATLAVLLRAANMLDACWGYKNKRYLYFGRPAARIDDGLHFIPARLSLFTTALAALLLRGHPLKALRCGLRHRHDHSSPNSAWGMAAFAGALGLRLGGPTGYDGLTENNPYLGHDRAILTARDIRRAQNLCLTASIVFALLMILLAYVITRLL